MFMRFPLVPRWLSFVPGGVWAVLLLAAASSTIYIAWPVPTRAKRDFWMFSPPNVPHYRAILEVWNAAHPDYRVNLVQIHYQALERRLLAAFMSDAPAADLVETESLTMARA